MDFEATFYPRENHYEFGAIADSCAIILKDNSNLYLVQHVCRDANIVAL